MATKTELDELMKASDESAAAAESLMDSDVSAMMKEASNIDSLKPSVVNEQEFNEVVRIVEQATRENQDVAAVKENLTRLGTGAVALVKQMAKLAAG